MIPAKRQENQAPEVRKAGEKDGPIKALRELGKPADVLLDTKARLFGV